MSYTCSKSSGIMVSMSITPRQKSRVALLKTTRVALKSPRITKQERVQSTFPSEYTIFGPMSSIKQSLSNTFQGSTKLQICSPKLCLVTSSKIFATASFVGRLNHHEGVEIVDEICLVQPSGGLRINAHPAHKHLRERAPGQPRTQCQRYYR
jgi:hypothetical protein